MTTPVKQDALDAVALRVLADRVKDATDPLRARLAAALDPGEKIPARIHGERIGQVWMTDPQTVYKVTDEAAFTAWVRAEMPENLQARYVFTDPEKVAEVLMLTGHGHLIETVVTSIPDWCRENVLRAAAAGAEVPGVQAVTRPGTLTVRPDKDAAATLDAAYRAGLYTVPVTLAVTAGQSTDEETAA